MVTRDPQHSHRTPSGVQASVVPTAEVRTSLPGHAAEVLASITAALLNSFDPAKSARAVLDHLAPAMAEQAVLVRRTPQWGLVEVDGPHPSDVTLVNAQTGSALAAALDKAVGATHLDLNQAELISLLGISSRFDLGAAARVHVLPMLSPLGPGGALVMIEPKVDYEVAEALAARIGPLLDLARLHADHAALAAGLSASLSLPDQPTWGELRCSFRLRTATAEVGVSGDFIELQGHDGEMFFALGDVCGKGTEAALVNGQVRQAIATAARLGESPARILGVANEILLASSSNRFVTGLCGRARLQPDGSALVEVSTAGHPAPLVLGLEGKVRTAEVSGRLLGVMVDAEPRDTVHLRLAPGEVMLTFSDGLIEARDASGEEFGIERLRIEIAEYAGMHPDIVCGAVEQAASDFAAGRLGDDMTLLAFGPKR